MMIRRHIWYFLLVSLPWTGLFAQNTDHLFRVTAQKFSPAYSLDESGLVEGERSGLTFPTYTLGPAVSSVAFSTGTTSDRIVCKIPFGRPESGSYLETHLFTERCDTVSISISDIADSLLIYKEVISKPGYTFQSPTKISLEGIDRDSLLISIRAMGGSPDKTLVVGRLEIYTLQTEEMEFRREISERDIVAVTGRIPENSKDPVFMTYPSHHSRYNGYSVSAELVMGDCASARDSIRYVSGFMDKYFRSYPISQGLSTDSILVTNRKAAESAANLDEYYAALRDLIMRVGNCHLTLALPGHTYNQPQPISFYTINGEIVVSAVFHESLSPMILPGDRLTAVCGVPVGELMPEFYYKVFATSSQQRYRKAEQRILTLAFEYFGEERITLSMEGSGGPYDVAVEGSNMDFRRKLPEDFYVLPSFAIETYGPVCYMRVSFTEGSMMPFLYSNRKEIAQADGMILDLRGLSGGDLSFCNLFGIFIDRVQPMLTSPDPDLSMKALSLPETTIVIRPSEDIHFSGPLAILVDSRTTCASELLVQALKRVNPQVFVVGTTPTAGGAQYAQRIVLPDAHFSYFQGLTRDAFGGVLDLQDGIPPDISVTIDSYADLIPYDDKVKDFALRFMNEYMLCY